MDSRSVNEIPSPERLAAIVEGLEARLELERYGGGVHRKFKPHPKQLAHLALGKTHRERLLMAGNRLGKSETGAFEAFLHMTGDYPDWWPGRRFDGPTKGWICGVTALDVRNVGQTKLCGQYGVAEAFGSGMIPRASFVDKPSLGRGVTDAFDTIQVRHKSGGVSVAQFKSYEQGREKFQGEGLDWLWADEEPPLELYGEMLARIGERSGLLWLTFTPLMGPTGVVLRFIDEPAADRVVTIMELDDALHLTPGQRVTMEAGYLAHEREARARGVPMLGSGRILIIAEESLVEPAIEQVPAWWKKLWGIDFGIDHPFGAVLILWDLDADVIHVHAALRIAEGLPVLHAQRMKPIGAGVPVAWPHDGHTRDKGSGEPLSRLYKKQGLRMLPNHATWPDGSNSVEAGILEWQEREASGRIKYASHLTELLEERRLYHRKGGLIVKIKDDLMSACRVAIMQKRDAKAVPLGRSMGRPYGGGQQIASGLDFLDDM